MITVFTPTYNRAYRIEKLYESLKRQTSKDFEWIVINDGSTDNTNELFEKWLVEDNGFNIVYREVHNGGKHRAINLGVQIASSDAFFIVDSDDYLTTDAIELVDNWFLQIANDETFAGVSGLRSDLAGNPIGGKPKICGEYVDCTNLQRHLYHLLDDKAEVYKTHILKKYPFPEFEGEKFVPESLIWDHIARDGYKLRWFERIIYICEYLEDGLTASSDKKFMDNPKGFLTYLAMLETVHNPKEVDVFRLQFYNNLIKTYGMDKALEIINMANTMDFSQYI
ncbi:Glycosyl transferase family 2 [Butyrivibrio sp. INlla18]|uniref:glycosyltransferase family 2 protein n=1 Tax=Butyrivibrio sp. INlla18 TaxID=1520806 RepID=UPI00088D0783|nr:glycosyltransferase family A protein [Butyrivibrio sp. INlla18]SDA41922.1 Glycosyl transferase family 2 [Butyrivibrio sp. INlla18]